MSGRRYDRLFARARDCLGWDDRTPVSAHVLRHTAITQIGRIAGYPVARAFAGHAPPTVTGRYLHATLADIAAAVAVLAGEPHPSTTKVTGTPGSPAPTRADDPGPSDQGIHTRDDERAAIGDRGPCRAVTLSSPSRVAATGEVARVGAAP